MLRYLAINIGFAVILLHVPAAYAQFSPGKLSSAHQKLEGINQCVHCHEVGREISGAKCLTCHTEIKSMVEAKRGFHYRVSSSTCISCHKEHLGQDAQTVLFDEERFNHSETEFILTGKHATTRCNRCHTAKNIKVSEVQEMISKTHRKTFLGLSSTCISCHEDLHRGAVGKECRSCHSTNAWLPASEFDHSRTKYPLSGRHAAVSCAKCHAEFAPALKEPPTFLLTKNFADCAPCHGSPHNKKFANQLCRSCHSTENWSSLPGRVFDHNLTAFKLARKHASLKCEECHKTKSDARFASTYRLPHARCIDCHTDYHRGEFLKAYNNDCTKCHTEESFQSSTFDWVQHNKLRFSLDGGHGAVPCASCHTKPSDGRRVFRFSNTRCESCHQDKHGGQFTKTMAGQSCSACHSTVDWKIRSFDHSRTNFPLFGKHGVTKCESCHKAIIVSGVAVTQYKGIETNCESCHGDVHAGQFAVAGKTKCETCHTPEAWRSLVFDHNRQSTFALTGAHKKVECRACHREELVSEKRILRFKPLSSTCESCHKA